MSRLLNDIFLLLSVVLLGMICSSQAFTIPRLAPIIRPQTDLKVSIRLAVNDKESTDSLLKKFKRCCNQSGHLRELRVKDQWETAAEKKKRKSTQARFRRRYERANERYMKLARGESEYDT